MWAVFCPGVDGREESAVGAVVDHGKGGRTQVAVDLQDRETVPTCFFEERWEDLGGPCHPVGLSLGTHIIRNRRQFANEQAMSVVAAPVSAQGDRHRLATVGRKEVGCQVVVLLLGQRKRGGWHDVSPS